MRKRRSTGKVTLQDVADYAGVGTMTVSRVMRKPDLVSEKLRSKVELAARALGYEPNQEASQLTESTHRVTLQDIANHAGVGAMTVSRALREPGLVSDATQKKINDAIRTLGYVPNQAAGALASAYQPAIAVLYPFQQDRTSVRFVQALQQAVGKHNIPLIMGCHEYRQHTEASMVEKLLQQRPAALVLFSAQLSQRTQDIIQASNVITVNVSGADALSANINIDIALAEAAEQLTMSLLEKGYRHVAYIGAHTDNRLQKQQLNGWNKAMLAHYHNADLKITIPEAPSLQFGRYAMTELLQNQPELDAIICSHEEIALGALFECQRRLMKVPYDLAIACLDGSEQCEHTFPALTAMRLDYEKLGAEVGRLVLAMMDNDDHPPVLEKVKFIFEPRASS
ncbi:LacI family DNA-binding transcriptional regulator [Pectobacterium versatile]|uniref:LacI family DNA-binding transcriptional regulator n=1 Tax=Pectobacterium versatile TaxID=2488639 RepID=A0A855MQD4_9GAMM|nr:MULTISPECIES: LacI family DNA-binding transcriptional regulator [Pectobacterium]MBA0160085.1 LacI family DNA-binding transcriptional regulator [Pectobacterium versatile]MBQ4774968.1 LacI family DNA-binding transcriptional regulator [Pectobacterium versatile]MBQ4779280.1 LacI family DNA-binding transcriptional regulator [Pectobacterium versatile]MBQ4783680.1 LacI family DNA-binding transcriptional regulator [Pectobacterium versatile]MBQ4790615.1 LacI family DNA-binding transcriptional regula